MVAKLLTIKSSPFRISFVSFGILFVNIFDINSVCAFLFSESLNKFVHTRYVGVTYGYIFTALLSSISNTAKSFFCLPSKLAPSIKVEASPELIFEPKWLSINSYPFSFKQSSIILHTVVFPFVPVTPIIVFGLSILPKKSGHRVTASFPGKYVASLPINFKAILDNFDKYNTIKNFKFFFIFFPLFFLYFIN